MLTDSWKAMENTKHSWHEVFDDQDLGDNTKEITLLQSFHLKTALKEKHEKK